MRTIVCLIVAIAALTALATTAGARNTSDCRHTTNHSFAQAAKNGALPGIYAALHGSAPITSLTCSPHRP